MWQSATKRYTIAYDQYNYRAYGVHEQTYSLSKHAPDDKLLYKVTKNWSSPIIKGSIVLMGLGLALFASSLLIHDSSAANIVGIAGITLILVSTASMAILEAATLVAKFKISQQY